MDKEKIFKIEKFINEINQNTTKKRSILWKYADEISYMLKKNIKLKIIFKYLKEQYNINLKEQYVIYFISKNKDKLLSMFEDKIDKQSNLNSNNRH